MDFEPRTVWDTSGRPYILDREIARGGEGTVFRERDGQYAVKLIRTRSEVESRERKRRCEWIMSCRIAEEARLVKPIALLSSPDHGYVMPLVRGHEPLTVLLAPKGDFAEWFNEETGGIRRRFSVLAQVAAAFRALHFAGLAYADVSDANVLISKNLGTPSICLVDPDNLSTSAEARSLVLGTPWYIAPEVLRGLCQPDILTDSHSLAVLAFRVLRMGHPLIGDIVRESPPEIEERALSGEWPYVEHPTQHSNRSSKLLPDTFLTQKLKNLFAKAFIDGLSNRMARPTDGEWCQALREAGDLCVDCTGCGRWFVDSMQRGADRECPWCNRPQGVPSKLLLFNVVRDKDISIPQTKPVGSIVLRQGNNYLWTRHEQVILPGDDKPSGLTVELVPSSTSLKVTNRKSEAIWWSSSPPKQEEEPNFRPGESIMLQDGDFLMIQTPHKSPARFIRYRKGRGR